MGRAKKFKDVNIGQKFRANDKTYRKTGGSLITQTRYSKEYKVKVNSVNVNNERDGFTFDKDRVVETV
jgi:hypothetical protein